MKRALTHISIFGALLFVSGCNTEIKPAQINPDKDLVKCTSNAFTYIFEPGTYKIIDTYIVDKRSSNGANTLYCTVINKKN